MAGYTFNTGDWIVVCDGAKALILQNKGDEKFPNFETLRVREQANPKTVGQGASPPGRVHSSATSKRSSVEQTDWHDLAEQEFLTNLVKELNADATANKIQALTIVAAPRALGMMRPNYSKPLNNVLVQEVAKDYASKPVYEIEKLLAT